MRAGRGARDGDGWGELGRNRKRERQVRRSVELARFRWHRRRRRRRRGLPSDATGVPAARAEDRDGGARGARVGRLRHRPNSDPDLKTCLGGDGDACSRAIASGRFAGDVLASLHNKRGFILTGRRDLEGAFADFEASLKLLPDNALGLAGRGGVYLQRRDMGHAIKDVEQSISADPNIFISYVIRAGYFLSQRDVDRARADYEKALSLPIDPASRKAVEGALKVLGAAGPAQASAAPADPKPAEAP
jgi:tetratricopeptide (TPR) repeat protein